MLLLFTYLLGFLQSLVEAINAPGRIYQRLLASVKWVRLRIDFQNEAIRFGVARPRLERRSIGHDDRYRTIRWMNAFLHNVLSASDVYLVQLSLIGDLDESLEKLHRAIGRAIRFDDPNIDRVLVAMQFLDFVGKRLLLFRHRSIEDSVEHLWVVRESNSRPSACKADALNHLS